jgi:hypothetical protein
MSADALATAYINFAGQSTFEVRLELPRALLLRPQPRAHVHWSPQAPRLLYLSLSCGASHAKPDRNARAAACLEAVVRRLDSRRM